MTGRTRDKSAVTEIFNVNGKCVKDPHEIANGFCSYFTQVGKQYADAIEQTDKTPTRILV